MQLMSFNVGFPTLKFCHLLFFHEPKVPHWELLLCRISYIETQKSLLSHKIDQVPLSSSMLLYEGFLRGLTESGCWVHPSGPRDRSGHVWTIPVEKGKASHTHVYVDTASKCRISSRFIKQTCLYPTRGKVPSHQHLQGIPDQAVCMRGKKGQRWAPPLFLGRICLGIFEVTHFFWSHPSSYPKGR